MVMRRYGRNIPPPLPAHRMLSRVAPTLPAYVDLRAFCGPVKDQGDEGSCTGHAFSSAIEWINRKYLARQPILSPQFFYAEELLFDGNFPNDDGSDGLTGCNVAVTKGCCEASAYPYVAGQILQPTADQLVNALEYTMGAYHGLTGSAVAMSVLGDPTPWPVPVGFTVYESFESDVVASTGIMPIPAPGEAVLGGHEVLMLGYDAAKRLALIQNSWGDAWGQAGFFWMPFEVLDASDTDLKIVHSGKPW